MTTPSSAKAKSTIVVGPAVFEVFLKQDSRMSPSVRGSERAGFNRILINLVECARNVDGVAHVENLPEGGLRVLPKTGWKIEWVRRRVEQRLQAYMDTHGPASLDSVVAEPPPRLT